MPVSRSAFASSAARSACAQRRRRRAARAIAARDRAHALDPLALRAELAVVDHLVQAGDARLERLLAVLVEEELRVGEARAHHALVAFDDAAGSAGADVADDEEPLVSVPPASSSGKYFWFAFIVRIRHSGGTARNSGSKRHSSTFGPLDQRVTSSSSAASSTARGRRGGRGVELARDLVAALVEARRSPRPVRSCAAYRRRRAPRPSRGRLEAVAAGRAAGLQAERADRHDVVAVQHDQPCAGRTNFTLVQPSRAGTHHLRDRQLLEARRALLQRLGERRAGDDAVDESASPLASMRA